MHIYKVIRLNSSFGREVEKEMDSFSFFSNFPWFCLIFNAIYPLPKTGCPQLAHVLALCLPTFCYWVLLTCNYTHLFLFDGPIVHILM